MSTSRGRTSRSTTGTERAPLPTGITGAVRYPRGDGDGWTRCARGHRHWGIFGAAGLQLWHEGSVLMQHRALWSHHGGTWGILGGARNSDETAALAAGREAQEEAGPEPGEYRIGREPV